MTCKVHSSGQAFCIGRLLRPAAVALKYAVLDQVGGLLLDFLLT